MSHLCTNHPLLSIQVWSKFELLLELLTELSRYRDYLVDLNKTDVIANIHNNSESNPIIETNHLSLRGVIIPTKSQITTSKFHHLSHLIRLFGGRKRIQDRLIGSHANNILIHQPGYQHIHFDVDFYIQLATFIKTDMLTKEPPVPCNILMPTADHLIGENRTDLVQTIEKNGGFEVIAKRLGVDVQPHNL